jgi:hypothetical protein
LLGNIIIIKGLGFMLERLRKKVLIVGAFQILLCGTVFWADFNVRERLREPSVYFSPEAVKLYNAAASGDMEKARNMVIEGIRADQKGPETTNQNIQQITLLSYSLGLNDTKAAHNLIVLGANPLYRPSSRNGDTFLFLISRKNTSMLKFLYSEWPLSKIPEVDQKNQAFFSVFNDCQECLETMFEKGVSPNIKDERGYNLFMEALANEDWDLATWLLSTIKVSVKAEANNGVTPANAIQFNLFRFPASSTTYEKILAMKTFVEKNYALKFPVETSLQIRTRKGLN